MHVCDLKKKKLLSAYWTSIIGWRSIKEIKLWTFFVPCFVDLDDENMGC
jgi:hypothetical protein